MSLPNPNSWVMTQNNFLPDIFLDVMSCSLVESLRRFDPWAGNTAQVLSLLVCSRSKMPAAFDFSFPCKCKAMIDVQGFLTECRYCKKSWSLLIEESHSWLPIWSMNAMNPRLGGLGPVQVWFPHAVSHKGRCHMLLGAVTPL